MRFEYIALHTSIIYPICVTYLDDVVVAMGGDALGAADGVVLSRAVEAVMVALVLDQIGVFGARLEELRAKQRPQPRRGAPPRLVAEQHAH